MILFIFSKLSQQLCQYLYYNMPSGVAYSEIGLPYSALFQFLEKSLITNYTQLPPSGINIYAYHTNGVLKQITVHPQNL
jgi:hypothetical protein